ncbi:MAG: hypothetical protein KGL15_01915 [Acidobacteriota bacterium]|nr:hypothetical protein [Acidobacteriota bacterium]
MTTPSTPQPSPAEPYDYYDDGYDDVLPVRKRAQYLTPLTALLMALILGGVGFYVGIRVEKSDASTTGGSGASAFARAFSGTRAPGSGGSTGSTGSTGSSKTGSSRTAFPGGGFAGFGGAGAGTIGTVSSISGNTLYVQETSGNTIRVKLSSATKITKSETVSKKKVYPNDQVVISGSKSANGTVSATSVTDSGASSSTSSSAGSTGSSSTGSGSSGGGTASQAVKSLFGGG